jgi:integrase/recombinase XerC
MDFDLLKEEFLSYLRIELNRSELTVKGYRKDLNVFQRYLKKSFQKEKVEITEITTNFVSSYLQHLATDLQHRPTTMRRHLATLKSFFNFAVLHEYLVKNHLAGTFARGN